MLVGARDPGKAAAAVRGLDRVTALAVPLDITDQASVEAALRAVEETTGRLDILANNAAAPGVLHPTRFRRRRARADGTAPVCDST
ncbi:MULTISPECIES: SDR family NAD(P)-dependent oxidoreductase [unclassified Streptomyces]|uniref:SDR family NAD(P)-dependent oxidoreductase n=1 Tax=unclassified Streptomyces TaxID=2593676 RepID=UPI00215618BB|nr:MULTISPECIES: SDR family NAD(P)-dependent oxidoreductase [unclassified Streptomyces]